jgi:ABC-2 type transport system permease protein
VSTVVADMLTAGGAVVRRDLLTMLSYRARFFTQLLSVFFSLTLFFYISRLVRVESFGSGDAYYAFAVIGLVILQLVNSTMQTPPMTLRQELVAGSFERIVASPGGPVTALAAMIVFPFLYSLVLALVMLTFAALIFGLSLEWATVPLAVPVAMLAGLAFAPFGLFLLALVLIFKQTVSGTTWIIAGISLIAGLYFPVSLLPDWIEWASAVQPFTPAVDLLRHLLVDNPLQDPAWLDVLKMALFAAVLLPASGWFVVRAVDRARRTGTITEY